MLADRLTNPSDCGEAGYFLFESATRFIQSQFDKDASGKLQHSEDCNILSIHTIVQNRSVYELCFIMVEGGCGVCFSTVTTYLLAGNPDGDWHIVQSIVSNQHDADPKPLVIRPIS